MAWRWGGAITLHFWVLKKPPSAPTPYLERMAHFQKSRKKIPPSRLICFPMTSAPINFFLCAFILQSPSNFHLRATEPLGRIAAGTHPSKGEGSPGEKKAVTLGEISQPPPFSFPNQSPAFSRFTSPKTFPVPSKKNRIRYFHLFGFQVILILWPISLSSPVFAFFCGVNQVETVWMLPLKIENPKKILRFLFPGPNLRMSLGG